MSETPRFEIIGLHFEYPKVGRFSLRRLMRLIRRLLGRPYQAPIAAKVSFDDDNEIEYVKLCIAAIRNDYITITVREGIVIAIEGSEEKSWG